MVACLGRVYWMGGREGMVGDNKRGSRSKGGWRRIAEDGEGRE